MPGSLARIFLTNPLQFFSDFLSIRSMECRSSPYDVRKANFPSGDGQSMFSFGRTTGAWAQAVAANAAKPTKQSKSRMTICISGDTIVPNPFGYAEIMHGSSLIKMKSASASLEQFAVWSTSWSPRLCLSFSRKTWMAGTSPAMTKGNNHPSRDCSTASVEIRDQAETLSRNAT